MKNVKIFVGVLTVLFIVILSGLNLKRGSDTIVYAASNEVTLAGTVEEVQEFYCPVTDDRGTHLTLKTDGNTTLVHVAISRFLREHKVAFKTGERIEVVGAKVRFEGRDGVIARQIARGNEVITLRDPAGKPLWSN